MGKLGVSKLALIAITVGVIAAVAFSVNIEEQDSASPALLESAEEGISKALILDQLHVDYPNEEYQQNATKLLKAAGFDEVDIVTTEDITVDFYKTLPEKNYKIIVARMHSLAIHEEGRESVWMFTGEKYTEDEYIMEQLSGQVSRAVPLTVTTAQAQGFEEAAQKRHFIVSSKLVDEGMVGNFPGTMVVLGGCDTMKFPFMAESLVERGASHVFGWHGLVNVDDNDRGTLMLLEEILINGEAPDDAAKKTMKQFYDDMLYKNGGLKHFSTGASEFEI